MAHFNRECVLKQMVHAKGYGAQGTFAAIHTSAVIPAGFRHSEPDYNN
jgi:catalase